MQRPDRDNWLRVFQDKISAPAQFAKDKKINIEGEPYDIASVMQYDDKVTGIGYKC